MVSKGTLIVSVLLALFAGTQLGYFLGGTTLSGTKAPQRQEQQNSAEHETHIADAKKFTEQNPKNVQGWIELGNMYYGAGRAQESILAYTRALELDPSNANVITDRGTMYRALKKYDLALAAYESASRIDPKHQNSLFNAGIVLFFDLKRPADARKKWEQLLRVNPNAKGPDGRLVKDIIQDL